jgi:type IV pilus assembly protein PilY1
VDPGDGGGAREIGVAILPGGVGSAPTTPTACQRWVKSTDSAPLAGYKARTSVRCWGTGKTLAYTDLVPGRTVTVVRADTGEILRVFARQSDMSLYASDTVSAAGRFTDVPLDSPMTGTPLVYPNDVGTDATKFFIGDADGTMWRFDLSNKDPSKWTGELYLDLYNQDVDTSATAWSDGQGFDVTPVLSLDPAGNVVINAATGSIQQFDTTGVEYVYSVTEKVAAGVTPKLRAYVNWWMQPATITSSPGERVSGPMTVFNGTLYFATFATAPSGTQACVNGAARLWGRDFVTPDDATCATNPTSCNRSLGGLRELQAPSAPTTPPPLYVEPDLSDPTLAGKVIPGVSIKATPACADLGSATGDQYVYGASHATPQNFVPGGYSLFTQIGAKGTNGQTTRQFEMAVPTPISPTIIDSWAAVLE